MHWLAKTWYLTSNWLKSYNIQVSFYLRMQEWLLKLSCIRNFFQGDGIWMYAGFAKSVCRPHCSGGGFRAPVNGLHLPQAICTKTTTIMLLDKVPLLFG